VTNELRIHVSEHTVEIETNSERQRDPSGNTF
jgi:hypothetical protein